MPIGELRFTPKIKEKRWNKSKEKELRELWDREGIYDFKFSPKDKRPIIVIDTPPPYPSGKWHVGGAAHYAQIDMVARYFRMKGYNVFLPFYADRNGLPVEVQVEKTKNVNPHELAKTPEGRQKFLDLCREFLDKVESELVSVWKRLGCSFYYIRDGTDSPTYRRMTQATFIELWRRGLIYEAERPVNWCPRCRTTLSDAELEHREEKTLLYYIKFRVKETNEEIIVATTRPELLAACDAVIYNPKDERYKHLKGKHAIVPIYDKEVKIIEHPEAKPEFGTGLVMICSYGDQRDIRLFKELGLKPVILITKDGRMNDKAGFLKGLKVKDARKRIAEELDRLGLLVKTEEIEHTVPVCWRCKTPVEFISVKEYFLKQLEFKEALKKITMKISFYPEFHRRKLLDWIDSISTDWPISRSRFYGTEIPLWHCRKCGAKLAPKPGKYYIPWKQEPPFEKCPHCGAPKEFLEGEKKVFDTWFDSSISALYVSGYMRDEEFFKRAFGNILRPQGIDIVGTWLYYSILRVYQLTGKPAFRWVRLTGMGLDEKGEAMHKSKGNVIDPDPYVEKYGADAFRFWAAAAGKLGSDYRFSEQVLKTGSLFATKLWNIGRFISAFPEPQSEPKLKPIDLMILEELNKVIEDCDRGYSELDVYEPINRIYQFVWNIFASHYIEAVKRRAYNKDGKYSTEEQEAAWYTLHKVFKASLKLLAPIMPYITDYIWRKMYSSRSIHLEEFPKPNEAWNRGYGKLLTPFIEVNSAVWKYKKQHNLSLGAELNARLYLPEELKPLANDIADLHRVKEISFGKPSGSAEKIGENIYLEKLN